MGTIAVDLNVIWEMSDKTGNRERRVPSPAAAPRSGAVTQPESVRRLAAVLAADVANYSRMMGADEEATMDACRSSKPDKSTKCSFMASHLEHSAG